VFDPELLSHPGTVLLDTARPDADNRASWCFRAPKRVLTASTADEVRPLVEALQAATSRGQFVAGYLSYEAGYSFVDLEEPEETEAPLGWFGVYETPHRLAPPDVEAGLRTLDGTPALQDVRLGVSRSEYTEAVQRIRRHIERGNVYQINYTAPLRFRLEGDPRLLYRRLRRRQHVPYGAYMNLGDRQILSCSPELFFRRTGDRVVTRPMKGTIRRGCTLAEDRALQEQLRADPKNRAENLMIVDLLRNDLSVCCRPGSVQVPSLYETEPYDSVTQMTSTVEGRLREDAGLSDVLRALFPCGSVTGAPKRRAMRLIRRLETTPRDVYCGAVGMAGPNDTAVFNVAIRTAVVNGEGEGTMGIGSGIVWDSNPDAEYEECRLKGQFLTEPSSAQVQTDTADPLKLIETMRFDSAHISLLDRHVERLARSAAYFSFPIKEERFRRRIDAAVAGLDPASVYKVRATLDRWGRIDVTTAPLGDPREGPWRLLVAEERVDRTDPYFYHKTTARGTYDRALKAAQAAGGDEAVLLNRNGEVTEGAYSNLFVRRGEALWTPPVSSGLLAGVYRDHVLDTHPDATERPLRLSDLKAADQIYCCNALRGWCKAQLVQRESPVT